MLTYNFQKGTILSCKYKMTIYQRLFSTHKLIRKNDHFVRDKWNDFIFPLEKSSKMMPIIILHKNDCGHEWRCLERDGEGSLSPGPLEKETATHCSILAWRIPWTEEPGGLQSMESQRVRHDWVTSIRFYGMYFSNHIQVFIHLTCQHITWVMEF